MIAYENIQEIDLAVLRQRKAVVTRTSASEQQHLAPAP